MLPLILIIMFSAAIGIALYERWHSGKTNTTKPAWTNVVGIVGAIGLVLTLAGLLNPEFRSM